MGDDFVKISSSRSHRVWCCETVLHLRGLGCIHCVHPRGNGGLISVPSYFTIALVSFILIFIHLSIEIFFVCFLALLS